MICSHDFSLSAISQLTVSGKLRSLQHAVLQQPPHIGVWRCWLQAPQCFQCNRSG